MTSCDNSPIHRNWLVRHWRGECTLARSFWINALLIHAMIWLICDVGLSISMYCSALSEEFFYYPVGGAPARNALLEPLANSVLYVITVFFQLAFFIGQVWWLVGVWRSSNAQLQAGKKFLARGLCILLAMTALASTILGYLPYLPCWARPSTSEQLYDEKPVIYLYPQKTQEVSVKLSYRGKLIAAYPKYDNSIGGWSVTAYPDGQLVNKADNRTYSYLFWDGVTEEMKNDLSTGFIVEGKDTAAFLQKTLEEIGLTPKEYNEFIVYWLPKMESNKYNLIHFAGKEYSDIAPLTIEPKPDALLRVFMVYKPLDKVIDLPVQKIVPFERKGFTVVEWGGSEVE